MKYDVYQSPGLSQQKTPAEPDVFVFNPLIPGFSGEREPAQPDGMSFNPLIPEFAEERKPAHPDVIVLNPLIITKTHDENEELERVGGK